MRLLSSVNPRLSDARTRVILRRVVCVGVMVPWRSWIAATKWRSRFASPRRLRSGSQGPLGSARSARLATRLHTPCCATSPTAPTVNRMARFNSN